MTSATARRAVLVLMIVAVDVVALWGLCAYGSRENIPD